MKKILLLVLVVVLLGGVIFIFIQTRPSGDIKLYKSYLTDESAEPSNNTVKVTFFGVSTLRVMTEKPKFSSMFFSRASLSYVLFKE